MSADQSLSVALRLSAVRAFIGVIRPNYRRIGIKVVGEEIQLSVVLDDSDVEARDEIFEEVSVAGTEIVADFLPPMTIREQVSVVSGPLPQAHIIDDGLIYQRWEEAHDR